MRSRSRLLPDRMRGVIEWPLRSATPVLGLLTLTVVGWIGVRLSNDASWRLVLDNWQWTFAYLTAGLLAARTWRRSRNEQRIVAGWICAGLLAMETGQLVWNLQIFHGWTPFPGPSDLFFVTAGLTMARGVWLAGSQSLERIARRIWMLDTLTLQSGVLCLSLIQYLPMKGEYSPLQLATMLAYPLAFALAPALIFTLILELRMRITMRMLLLPTSLCVLALLWGEWNRRFLSNQLVDGAWLNIGFSVTFLAIAYCTRWFQFERSTDERWASICDGLTRLLPLVVVLLAAGGILVISLSGIYDEDAQVITGCVALLAVLFASVRQAYMLRDRQLLVKAQRLLSQREAELEALNRDLEHRFAERTQLLHQANTSLLETVNALDLAKTGLQQSVERQKEMTAEVEHSRLLAEQGSLAKSQFLANMSHEIRTPMNAIIGLSKLALGREMPAGLQDYLQKIHSSGEHLLGIINDILDFSKIEAGKLDIEAVAFELEDLLGNVVNVLNQRMDAKGLELVLMVDHTIPRVLVGDALRLGQILINLSNNAVKFTAEGEVRINIRTEQASDTDVLLRFEVCDTGIGLTETQIGMLFKSFAQADTSTTRKYGGTGLGLAISKSLSEAMGGDIGVHSNYGQGSTFWFTARLGIGSRERFVQRASADLQHCRILVVDDNDSAALVLSEILREMGFDVDCASNGALALERIEQASITHQPFDIVALDWHMPGMDGLQVAQAIRSQPLQPQPRLFMVSAYRKDELVQGAHALGIQHVLSKPVCASQLFNAVMEVMGHSLRPVPKKQATESDLTAQLAPLRGARILLVEDNEINQQVACELLHSVGFQVDVAEHGSAALSWVQARQSEKLPFDLVLMDMQMPVMDGVTATRILRETWPADRLPIVAMTANAMQADKDRCLQAGMNTVVTKPIHPDALWKAILQWMRPRPGLGTLPATPQTQTAEAQKRPAEVDVAVPAILQSLRGIAGLDVDFGVTHANRDARFYVTILRKFLAGQADAGTRLHASLAQGDVAGAERIAHTLKGLAAGLGYGPLENHASKLEAALREGSNSSALAAHLEQTCRALENLVGALQSIAPLHPQQGAALSGLSPQQQQEAQALSQQIAAMIRNDDATAVQVWESHASVLRAFHPQSRAIEAAIAAFDFEQALSLMEQTSLQP